MRILSPDQPINSTYNPIVRVEHEVISNRDAQTEQVQANVPITSIQLDDIEIEINKIEDEDLLAIEEGKERSGSFNPLGIIQAGVNLANEKINFSLPKMVPPAFQAVQLEVSGKTDLNFIETPYDEVYGLNPYTQTVVGYGGSFKARVDFKTFLIETGISYGKKLYHPKEIIEFFDGDIRAGYRGISLSQIEMDIISVPLNIVHYISKEGPWRFYSKVGASMHMIGLSDYYLQEYARGTGNQPASIPSENEADILEKNFENGIAQGGSFSNNTYFTLNMGLGIEKFVTDRYSLFAEPYYQHGIFNPQLGPNKDNIHNLTLSLGARVTL